MGCLSKLIIVDNLGCPKCKRNSAEFLEKKNLPSNKEDILEFLTLIKSYSQTITGTNEWLASANGIRRDDRDKRLISFG